MTQVSDASAADPAVQTRATLGWFELAAVWTLLGGVFLLRILYAVHLHMDSDETQHLHVAWGWAHGLMQYRDVFDNHSPLFHMLCAPLVAVLGDRADLLIWMRLAMLPLFAAALFAVYLMGRATFSPRVGLWAAVWIAVLRPFFVTSIEFRADDLWMVLWLLGIAILVRPPLTPRRCLVAGVVVGAALGASLKTGLLMTCLLPAATMAGLVVGRAIPWRRLVPKVVRGAASGALGMALVPGMIVLYFAVQGALPALRYGTTGHNSIVAGGSPTEHWGLIVGAIAVVTAGGWGCLRRETPASLTARRVFLVLLAGLSLGSLAFWPMLNPQSYLAVYPLLGIPVVATLEKILQLVSRIPLLKATARSREVTWLTIVSIAALVQLVILASRAPWQSELAGPMRMWQAVLRLTDPGQKVFDLKGELLLRPRTCYYMFESVTEIRFSRGLLTDDIPEQLIQARTCVASIGKKRLPPRARQFILDNYVLVGPVLVVGKWLEPGAAGPHPQAASLAGNVIPFDVAIPARYAIGTPAGQVGAGILDGQPYDGPRELVAGPHEYRPVSGEKNLVLIWAQALERGFLPMESLPAEWQP